MFRDPEQRGRVFARLLETGVLPADCFTAAGPTERAQRTAQPAGRDGSAGTDAAETAPRLVRVALAIWQGSGALPLADVLRLEPEAQRSVGSLLMAVGLGHAAIDRWLEESCVSGA